MPTSKPEGPAALRRLKEYVTKEQKRIGRGRTAIDCAQRNVLNDVQRLLRDAASALASKQEEDDLTRRVSLPSTEAPQPAPNNEEPSCAHGFALDMHCCDCKRSGFFHPSDCSCAYSFSDQFCPRCRSAMVPDDSMKPYVVGGRVFSCPRCPTSLSVDPSDLKGRG